MKFREAKDEDHELLRYEIKLPGCPPIKSVKEAWVTDNEEGSRYWVVTCPYTYGQFRIQMWHERTRDEPYPDIFHEL